MLNRTRKDGKDPKGWDGVNTWVVYNGDGNGNWGAEEVWQQGEPDVYNSGIAGLTLDDINNFIVFQNYSDIICEVNPATGKNECTATVVTERVWDTQTAGKGYQIEEKFERPY